MLDIAYYSSNNHKENNFNAFKKSYVIGRGNEGSIGFSLKNGAVMGFRRKKSDQNEEINISPEDYNIVPEKEEQKLNNICAYENAKLIEKYFKTNTTGLKYLDTKIKLTSQAILDMVQKYH